MPKLLAVAVPSEKEVRREPWRARAGSRRWAVRALTLALALSLLAVALPSAASAKPSWLISARILVKSNPANQDCRTGVCQHNENTDLKWWHGAIYLVHRTANSQVLGPNSSLRVYRSLDRGRTFSLQAIIPAPAGRDIRDPCFYIVGKRLFVKAITRLPGFELRDQAAGSITVQTHSSDGRTWSATRAIGPAGWGFWRVVKHDGVYYSTAYEDGDLRIVLYRSHDGINWSAGPQVYGVSADTPLEAELAFSPSGKYMLALVRMDGNNTDLLGFQGRLRTKVCWSRPPFARFTCPETLHGVRLDGSVAFYWGQRLFVIAREHLHGPGIRKRTALYEITGNLEGGPIGIHKWGEFPSAGDTSYAGVVPLGRGRFLVSWYSSPLKGDPSWLAGFSGPTNIWIATINLSHL
jgi:hypothetical protein